MGLIRWAENRTNALTMWDIGVVKIYCILFGIIVGAFIPTLVREHLWWFGGAVVVLGVGLAFRWFTAGTPD